MAFNTPILFLIFNRPSTTRQVFDEIRKQKPKYLYVAADGPRKNSLADIEKCIQTREIIEKGIDWDCEVKTLFRDENLGCGKAVSYAITWFFNNVEEGIILEDDCLPHSDFFGYCETMLQLYRNEEKIMFISGTNYSPLKRTDSSYYFSIFSHVWGWASWKRAWEKYTFEVGKFDQIVFSKKMSVLSNNSSIKKYWNNILQVMSKNAVDTWDYQLSLSIINCGCLSVIPSKNLIINIGFNSDATHTSSHNAFYCRKFENLLPLVHPSSVKVNKELDNLFFCELSIYNYKTIIGELSYKPKALLKKGYFFLRIIHASILMNYYKVVFTA